MKPKDVHIDNLFVTHCSRCCQNDSLGYNLCQPAADQETGHYLNYMLVGLLMHICVTRPSSVLNSIHILYISHLHYCATIICSNWVCEGFITQLCDIMISENYLIQIETHATRDCLIHHFVRLGEYLAVPVPILSPQTLVIHPEWVWKFLIGDIPCLKLTPQTM